MPTELRFWRSAYFFPASDNYLSTTRPVTRRTRDLETKRLLPYVAAILLLAFALGSLPRSQPGGTTLLLNSYWLLYALYFLPIIALGVMFVTTLLLAYYWRSMSDAIGFGLARRRKVQVRKKRRITFIVWMGAWAFAVVFLLEKCGSIPCQNSGTRPGDTVYVYANAVLGNDGTSNLPSYLGSASITIGNIVGSAWFAYSFLGLLAVSFIIMLRAVKVSLDESKSDVVETPIPKEEGVLAVEEAMKITEDPETPDPRMRIIHCYQRMIRAASDLGAPVSQDQTARELELGIRRVLTLKGPAIRELTQLFEEARYSLHPITQEDSKHAHDCLVSISEELNLRTNVQA